MDATYKDGSPVGEKRIHGASQDFVRKFRSKANGTGHKVDSFCIEDTYTAKLSTKAVQVVTILPDVRIAGNLLRQSPGLAHPWFALERPGERLDFLE